MSCKIGKVKKGKKGAFTPCNPEFLEVSWSSVGLEHPLSTLPLLHLVQCSAREPRPWGRAKLLYGFSLLVTWFTKGVSDEKCCLTRC